MAVDYHILIVDDEKELCMSLCEILTEEVFSTTWTSEPRETPSILARSRVDLIILDIRMPGIGGIDLVLFVVAADESIKPQTREHFDICRLLDVSRGLVALTKADLVERDILELVRCG